MSMLDTNFKVDFTKLRMLALPSGRTQTWQQDEIATLMSAGTLGGKLVERFSARVIYHRDHFVTLLHCMGLLTIAGQSRGELTSRVPNLVSASIHWESIAIMLNELEGTTVDSRMLVTAVQDMAYDGNLETMISLMKEGVLAKLSRRDHRRYDERYIKLIFLAYLSLSPVYIPLSEVEHRFGYSDLFLGLDGRFSDAKYTWKLEFKHLKEGEAGPEEIEKAHVAAKTQLEAYLKDSGVVKLVKGDRVLRAASIVSVGREDLHFWLEAEV